MTDLEKLLLNPVKMAEGMEGVVKESPQQNGETPEQTSDEKTISGKDLPFYLDFIAKEQVCACLVTSFEVLGSSPDSLFWVAPQSFLSSLLDLVANGGQMSSGTSHYWRGRSRSLIPDSHCERCARYPCYGKGLTPTFWYLP